jgi:hypothetical protein
MRSALSAAVVPFARALARFGAAVRAHCSLHNGEPPSVADVPAFQAFADEHAPGLFDLFALGLPHARASDDKCQDVREKTPALLLSLLYRRSSQKHSAFAKRKNAVLRLAGTSDAGIAIMHALGDHASSRTQRRHALERVAQHSSVVSNTLAASLCSRQPSPLHLVTDDFTISGSARAPTVGGTSVTLFLFFCFFFVFFFCLTIRPR